MRTSISLSTFLIALICTSNVSVYAATTTWTGGTNTNWTTGSNWNNGAPTGGNDAALFTGLGSPNASPTQGTNLTMNRVIFKAGGASHTIGFTRFTDNNSSSPSFIVVEGGNTNDQTINANRSSGPYGFSLNPNADASTNHQIFHGGTGLLTVGSSQGPGIGVNRRPTLGLSAAGVGTLTVNASGGDVYIGRIGANGELRITDGFNTSNATTPPNEVAGTTLSLTKLGSQTLTIADDSTYSGTTTVSAGTLVVDGNHTTAGAYTVAAGATLSGSGSTDGSLVLNGTISPGDSPGTFATGSETWNNGGDFEFEIDDVNGAAGSDPGWDLLDITGTLDLTGLTAGGFTVDIISLLHPSHASGDAANFSFLSDYTWEFVRTSGGINGFDPDDFVLDASAFTNETDRGYFSIQQTDNSLELTFTAVTIPEPSAIILAAFGLLGLGFRPRRTR